MSITTLWQIYELIYNRKQSSQHFISVIESQVQLIVEPVLYVENSNIKRFIVFASITAISRAFKSNEIKCQYCGKNMYESAAWAFRAQ